jgi:hypothetical protein
MTTIRFLRELSGIPEENGHRYFRMIYTGFCIIHNLFGQKKGFPGTFYTHTVLNFGGMPPSGTVLQHLPLLQFEAAEQTRPQDPQLFTSVWTLTHVPPQFI